MCVNIYAQTAGLTLPLNGRIANTEIGLNAEIQLHVSLNDAAEGGKVIWSETHTTTLNNGWFNVELGSNVELPSAAKFTENLWVSLAVNSEPEILNRIPLSIAAKSIMAHSVNGRIIKGTSIDNDVLVKSFNGLKDDVIFEGDSSFVLNAESNTIKLSLSSNAIQADNISKGAVVQSKIKDEAVTEGKLKISNKGNDKTDGYVLAWDQKNNIMRWVPLSGKFSQVGVDSLSTPGHLGNTGEEGVLRVDSSLTYTSGGDFITFGIADDAINKDKINANVAGLGLGQNADGSLEVTPDDSTLELNGDTLRLKDFGIGTSKLNDLAVTAAKLSDDAVMTSKIFDNAVTKEKVNSDVAGLGLAKDVDGSLRAIVDDSTLEINVDTLRIKDLAVSSEKLALDAVRNINLADSAVQTENILDGTILAEDLDSNSVITAKILDLNVTTSKIADLSVVNAKLADTSVTKEKINADVAGLGLAKDTDGTLRAIVDDSTLEVNVDTLRIKDLAISSDKLAADAVRNFNLADSSVLTENILDGTILNADLADSSITSIKIVDSTITTDDIVDNAITTTKINANAVDKDKLAADVAGNGLGQNVDGSLETNVDNIGIEVSVDALRLKDLGVLTAKLADDAVTNAKLADNAVQTENIVDGTVTIDDLGDNSVGSAELVDASILNDDLADNSITSSKVVDGTLVNVDYADQSVSTEKILDATILNEDLADNSITSVKVVDGTLGTADLADNSVTTAKLNIDAVDKDKIAGDVAGDGIGQNLDGS